MKPSNRASSSFSSSKKSKNQEDMEVQESMQEETQLLQAIKGLKQELNLARSNISIVRAANPNGPLHQSVLHKNDSGDISQSFAELEESLDRLCIQEAVMSYSVENQTLQNLICTESLNSELKELLNEYISNELLLTTRSTDIREEYLQLQEAKIKCFQCLRKYVANEREQRQHLQEDSHSENSEAARAQNRKLKEIRFMQLIIPRIISQKRVNFQENEWLIELCRKIRAPILSSDDLL